MKTRNENFAVRVLTVAVQAALTAMFAVPFVAQAQEDVVKALTRPDNFVEIGATAVSDSSAKFGEYNGLNKANGSLIGNFSVKGGDAYDGTGVTRFEFSGKDLGTTSREFGASIAEQGRWSLSFGYDELQHNLSDTYQTPYVEKMGGNSFTLPSNFGYVNTFGSTNVTKSGLFSVGAGGLAGTGAAGNTWVAGTRDMSVTQKSAFHIEEIGTTRKNTSFGAGFIFNKEWNIQLGLNRLEQTGAKEQGVATQSYSSVPAPTFGAVVVAGSGTNTWKNQGSIMALSPTNYQTNTVDLALNWAGEKGYMAASYYGSFFVDGYNSYSIQSPMANGTGSAVGGVGTTGGALNQPALVSGCVGINCYATETMSTAPSNSFNQLNLSGGYAFSNKTKLSGGISYGRNTQDDTFMNDPMMFKNPSGSSLNGLVITKNANFKVTDQSFKDLTLTGGFKYNERDNETASNVYKFYSINVANTVVVPAGTGVQTVVNAPFSNKKTQIDLSGDYRLGKNNNIRLGYEREDASRWCSNVAANATPYYGPAMPANANCVLSPSSTEDKLSLNYRNKLSSDVSFGVGYAYGNRSSAYDPKFFNTVYGIHGAEIVGFRPFFEASRIQNMLKTNVNWQANEKLSLSANARYSNETYQDSTLGVQDGSTSGVNLDATYGYSENGTVSAFASWLSKDKKARLSSNGSKDPLISPQVVPTGFWINSQNDNDNTVGVNFTQKGLMGGKLTFTGDLTFSHSVTAQSVADAGLNTTKTSVNLCGLSNIGLCGSYPDVVNDVTQLKLVSTYAVDKKSTLAFTYIYQKLSSNDYFYNGYQYGYTASAQMPTNEVAPNYTVQAIGVSYTYSF